MRCPNPSLYATEPNVLLRPKALLANEQMFCQLETINYRIDFSRYFGNWKSGAIRNITTECRRLEGKVKMIWCEQCEIMENDEDVTNALRLQTRKSNENCLSSSKQFVCSDCEIGSLLGQMINARDFAIEFRNAVRLLVADELLDPHFNSERGGSAEAWERRSCFQRRRRAAAGLERRRRGSEPPKQAQQLFAMRSNTAFYGD